MLNLMYFFKQLTQMVISNAQIIIPLEQPVEPLSQAIQYLVPLQHFIAVSNRDQVITPEPLRQQNLMGSHWPLHSHRLSSSQL